MRNQISMRRQVSIALAAGTLMAGVSGMGAPHTWWSRQQRRDGLSDFLSLTYDQKKTAWKDLYWRAADQQRPWLRRVGRLGAPEQRQDRADYAQGRPRRAGLRPYDFAIVHGTLVIVNPSDRIIAEVIEGEQAFAA